MYKCVQGVRALPLWSMEWQESKIKGADITLPDKSGNRKVSVSVVLRENLDSVQCLRRLRAGKAQLLLPTLPSSNDAVGFVFSLSSIICPSPFPIDGLLGPSFPHLLKSWSVLEDVPVCTSYFILSQSWFSKVFCFLCLFCPFFFLEKLSE